MELCGEVYNVCGNKGRKFLNCVEMRGNMQYESLAYGMDAAARVCLITIALLTLLKLLGIVVSRLEYDLAEVQIRPSSKNGVVYSFSDHRSIDG